MAAMLALPKGPLRRLVGTNTNKPAALVPGRRPGLRSRPTRPRTLRPQPPCPQRYPPSPAIGSSAALARPSPLPIGCWPDLAELDFGSSQLPGGREAEQFKELSDWMVGLLARGQSSQWMG